MADEPAFVQESDLAWEGWAEDQVAQRGSVKWKTLISAGMTPSRGLTAGVALIAPEATCALTTILRPRSILFSREPERS